MAQHHHPAQTRSRLTAGGAARGRAGRPGRRARSRAPTCARAQAADRERRHACASCARPASCEPDEVHLPRQHRQVPAGDRRRDARRLRRLGGHPPADRGRRQHRRRPGHRHRLGRRPAHLCRQADRADRRRRLSRQALRRLDASSREKYGKQRQAPTTGSACRSAAPTGPLVYRKSAVKEAGFDTIPNDHAGFLKLCQALKKINKPAGFALGNAVGDGNGFANWLIWSHGGYLVDEDGKVAINSKETIAALNYLKELYPTFVAGHARLGRPEQQPRLCRERGLADGERRLALLRAEERSGDCARSPRTPSTRRCRSASSASAPRRSLIAQRHGVQAQQVPERGQGLLAFMMEAEQYDPWLTGCLGYWAHPLRGLREERGLGVAIRSSRSTATAREQPVLDRLQGPDHAGRRRGRRRIRHGADVRLGRLRPGDAARRRRAKPSAARAATIR